MIRKGILSIGISMVYVIGLFPQDQQTNLEKYWRYRDRLKENFVLISPNVEEFGTNISAQAYMFHNGQKVWTEPFHLMWWGDANSDLNHYLSVLITEYVLLTENNLNADQTLAELVYALIAWERLDAYAEYHIRKAYNFKVENNKQLENEFFSIDDINGIFVRDDVDQKFWENHHGHFFNLPDGERYFKSEFLNATEIINSDRETDGENFPGLKLMSQDNIIHLLESISLCHKLMPNEVSIENVPINWGNTDVFPNGFSPIKNYLTKQGILDGDKIYFKKWAEDIVSRLIDCMYHPDSPAEACLEVEITKNWTHNYCQKLNWYIYHPVFNTFLQQGGGEDMSTDMFFSYGLLNTARFIAGENAYPEPEFTSRNAMWTDNVINEEISDMSKVLKDMFGIPTILGAIISSPMQFSDNPDFYIKNVYKKVMKLSAYSAYQNVDFYVDKLLPKTMNDHYFDELPLVWLILHNEMYGSEIQGKYEEINPGLNIKSDLRSYYENILNMAPNCGHRNYKTDDSHYYWQGSRLIWPNEEDVLQSIEGRHCQEDSGLDFMLVYNLFQYTFGSNTMFLAPIEESSVLTDEDYSSSDISSLTSYSEIYGGNVDYKALETVKLVPGFHVESDDQSSFVARIGSSAGYFYFNYSPVDSLFCDYNYFADAEDGILPGCTLKEVNKSVAVKKVFKENIIETTESFSNRLSVAPNPANTKISVFFVTNSHISSLIIYDLKGAEVYRTDDVYNGISINISDFAKGYYTLKVISDEVTGYKKIIVN